MKNIDLKGGVGLSDEELANVFGGCRRTVTTKPKLTKKKLLPGVPKTGTKVRPQTLAGLQAPSPSPRFSTTTLATDE